MLFVLDKHLRQNLVRWGIRHRLQGLVTGCNRNALCRKRFFVLGLNVKGYDQHSSNETKWYKYEYGYG